VGECHNWRLLDIRASVKSPYFALYFTAESFKASIPGKFSPAKKSIHAPPPVLT